MVVADVPRPPIILGAIPELITASSVVITWMPGFDGGLSQSFIIQYRKLDDHWKNTTRIPDEHTEKINYTVNQLAGDTIYEIQMFAENALGCSNSSSVVTVTTLTDGKPC